jgi:glycosyltransferase involved in cell wall biosynthesis
MVLTEHVGFVKYRAAALNAIQRTAWTTIGNMVVRTVESVATYNRRIQTWLLARYPRKKIEYIGNGVDLGKFRPRSDPERRHLRQKFGLPSDAIVVVYVGRHAEKKNLDTVLRIPRDGFHLVVCGAKRGLLGTNLTDLGVIPHPQMPDLLACVDVMVHAATAEGFPLAVQEGIASGLPLVILWDNGYEGWLEPKAVRACERLDEIGTAVHQLTQNEAERVRLGVEGRRWAEQRWSWDRTVEAYEELYGDGIRRECHAA